MKGRVTTRTPKQTTINTSAFLNGQVYSGRIYFYVGSCGDTKGQLMARTKDKGLKRLRTKDGEPIIIPEFSGRCGFIYGNSITM